MEALFCFSATDISVFPLVCVPDWLSYFSLLVFWLFMCHSIFPCLRAYLCGGLFVCSRTCFCLFTFLCSYMRSFLTELC